MAGDELRQPATGLITKDLKFKSISPRSLRLCGE